MQKRVISISIGSSKRNHKATVEWLGHTIEVERRGTDGDINAAVKLVQELDGHVDAFGLGGMDLTLTAEGGKKYPLHATDPIARAARKTPIVDGAAIKNTLERQIVKYLQQEQLLDMQGQTVLMVCALDRNGMARAVQEAGAHMIIGDLMYSLGIPIPIHSMTTLRHVADVVLPVISRLPFSWIYPIGEKQHENNPRKYRKYYDAAQVICGDYHFIYKYMPMDMRGKTVLTNTVTPRDIDLMRQRGVELLVTSTPDIAGRSFGTNVLQAMLVSLIGKRPEDICEAEYLELFEQLPCTYRTIWLQREEQPAVSTYIG